MKEPKHKHCKKNKVVYEDENSIGYACYYPQMCGYTGKCVAVISKNLSHSCIDCYVWHDGEFPFTEEYGEPKVVHHCSADQFIEFGQFLRSKIEIVNYFEGQKKAPAKDQGE